VAPFVPSTDWRLVDSQDRRPELRVVLSSGQLTERVCDALGDDQAHMRQRPTEAQSEKSPEDGSF
jgi:hypothetical protein